MEKNKRKRPLMMLAKAAMLCLTAIYPLFMVVLSGAGLLYNKANYGEDIALTGKLLIVSGAVMAAGAVLCLFRRNICNAVSLFCSGGGLALCMSMMYKLCQHADSAGWSDKYTMTPISDMYRSRIMPSIVPAVIAVIIALLQLFSYEAAEERRKRRESKEVPASKIIGD